MKCDEADGSVVEEEGGGIVDAAEVDERGDGDGDGDDAAAVCMCR